MITLGISGSLIYPNNHDCATALVIDGKLVENLEEERFNRIKHSIGKFPVLTIKEVLKKHNLKLEDIDAIGIPFDIKHKDSYIKQFIELIEPDCKKIPQFFYKTHHIAHAYDAFYQSGFETCASLVIDGSGDLRDGITLGQFTKDGYKTLRVYDISQSLGEMYASTCSYVGLSSNGFGEGKLMGLAPFGKPIEKPLLYWNETNKNIELNYQLVSEELEHNDIYAGMMQFLKKTCYPYEEGLNGLDNTYEEDDYLYEKYDKKLLSSEVIYYQNVAATCQKAFNEIYLGLVKYIKELTGEDNLVLSGGCIQNCIGNNVIVESGIFKNVFATPAPYDGGCAVGLAFYAYECMGNKPISKRTTISYTGKSYTDDEILSSIDKNEFDIIDYDENMLSKCLYGGDIFAWFQGGSEIGPRALGHRSIIASPHNRENLTRINLLIKNRELFRPLAPSVADELFDKIFDTNSKDLTEFMLRTIEIRPEMRSKIPAVCHIDNTTRPQCLRKEDNPEFYSLLMNFYNTYKIPCLINTSFNGRGQPIIETPEQAIEFLKNNNELEGIVFNAKYIIFKK